MTRPSRIIGLTGRAQHGKDTTAEYLVKHYGYERFAFATPLKNMALALNPWVGVNEGTRLADLVSIRGWEEAKKDTEVRRFLQTLGTEAVRNYLGEDAWLDAMDVQTQGKLADGKSRIVISDVRFPNELDYIKAWGGDVWRVRRLVKKGRKLVPFDNGLGADHPSEKYVDKLRVDVELKALDLDMLYREIERTFDVDA